MFKTKKVTVVLLTAVFILLFVLGKSRVRASDINSESDVTEETDEKQAVCFGAEDPESILKQLEQTEKIFHDTESEASQKYGEDYVSVKAQREENQILRSAVMGRAAGGQIYSQVLKPNVAGITVVRYYPQGGYDIMLNWTEGILGASTGERLYCADPSAGFSAGYKTGVPGTNYFSQYTIDFMAAVFYYYDNYMCRGLSDDQDYIMKQIAFWYFANMSRNWYPGCYFEFSKNYYCGNGHNLFEHRAELLDGAGLLWATENYEKMDADMTVYEGDGQPLMKIDYRYNTTGTLKLRKVSANKEITDENPCYTLEGAQYGVYKEKECKNQIGILTTDENGESNKLEVKEGTWYVKELKAPLGYAMDLQVYEAVVTGNLETELKVYDIPAMDHAEILLEKIDEHAEGKGAGTDLKLGGAQFEVKYYKEIYEEDPAKSGEEPDRSWVLQTDSEGKCKLDETYFVSGDEFYRSRSGEPGIPMGTVIIREILAPQGYLLNEKVYIVRIQGENEGKEFVDFYQAPQVVEERLQLEIIKTLKGTRQTVPGVVFRHTMPDQSTHTITTDKNGKAVLESLVWGRHTIEEIYVPDGIIKNPGKVIFTVEKGNKINVESNTSTEEDGIIVFSVIDNGNISMKVEDILAPYELLIHKTNQNDKVLSGAEFTLYEDKECTIKIQKKVSDTDGNVLFSGLQNEVRYYVKETKAPKGYRIPAGEDGTPVVYEVYTKSNPAEGVFEYYLNGEKCLDIEGTAAERVIRLNVTNYAETQLPETGTLWISGIWTSGMFCMVLALSGAWYVRNKRREA